MSISRWMDKKVVLHIHNGILLSYKKECIWVSSDEVDEPRTYYTEWSESGREREISYLNAHIQNLEKWYWRIYLQGSNGEGNGTPLQYSCLENPVDGGAWWAAVHGVAKSRTRLSDVTFTFHFHALEKEMATHSSVLAWRIPGTGDPGGLPSMRSRRVGHDWSDLAAMEKQT